MRKQKHSPLGGDALDYLQPKAAERYSQDCHSRNSDCISVPCGQCRICRTRRLHRRSRRHGSLQRADGFFVPLFDVLCRVGDDSHAPNSVPIGRRGHRETHCPVSSHWILLLRECGHERLGIGSSPLGHRAAVQHGRRDAERGIDPFHLRRSHHQPELYVDRGRQRRRPALTHRHVRLGLQRQLLYPAGQHLVLARSHYARPQQRHGTAMQELFEQHP